MTIRKIAFVTDDGHTISAHFGRAAYYQVLSVEGRDVVAEERRDKAGHDDFAPKEGGQHHGQEHAEGHGFGTHAQSKHARMIAAITDCEAVISRGMGRGAYLSLQEANITPVVTDIPDIHQAAKAYLDGTLVNHIERLH